MKSTPTPTPPPPPPHTHTWFAGLAHSEEPDPILFHPISVYSPFITFYQSEILFVRECVCVGLTLSIQNYAQPDRTRLLRTANNSNDIGA